MNSAGSIRKLGTTIMVCLALVAVLLLPTSPAAQADQTANTARTAGDPGMAIAVSRDFGGALAAVKADGTLYTRMFDENFTMSPWQRHGASTWTSVDMDINEDNGDIVLLGTKDDGRLYTRRYDADNGWQGFVLHGQPSWDPDIRPSIDVRDYVFATTVAIAAIKNNGDLWTRVTTREDEWSNAPWVKHGLPGWAQVEIAYSSLASHLHLAAVKADGRLYTRVYEDLAQSRGWKEFRQQGLPNWSTDHPPSLTGRSNNVILAAVKASGRLYTREILFRLDPRPGFDTPTAWSAHGADTWVSAVILKSGWLLVGVKTDGRLYTRERTSDGWQPWRLQGAATWSTGSRPALAWADNNFLTVNQARDPLAFLAVKDDGRLYLRRMTPHVENQSNPSDPLNYPWLLLGRPTWDTGL